MEISARLINSQTKLRLRLSPTSLILNTINNYKCANVFVNISWLDEKKSAVLFFHFRFAHNFFQTLETAGSPAPARLWLAQWTTFLRQCSAPIGLKLCQSKVTVQRAVVVVAFVKSGFASVNGVFKMHFNASSDSCSRHALLELSEPRAVMRAPVTGAAVSGVSLALIAAALMYACHRKRLFIFTAPVRPFMCLCLWHKKSNRYRKS